MTHVVPPYHDGVVRPFPKGKRRLSPFPTFHPDPSSKPYLPITELELHDGSARIASRASVSGDTEFRHQISCTQSGKHTLTVRSHVLGPLADASAATTTIDVDCPSSSSDGGCSTAPKSSSPFDSFGVVALGAAVACAVRRRR